MCIFHEALSVQGVTMEEGLAITALAGHEHRPAFLEWFGQNPGSADTGPIKLLEAVARNRDRLLRELLGLPLEQGNGPRALAIVRSALGVSSSTGVGSPPQDRRSCCGA